ncbi:MAG: hypothetical protein HYS17_00810 [Micavibrio aeruginosavorus]|uniref:Uncharacterized protein n=1 Tax=Micavibrio aeruginosavorus TaxID=349221 RepID=A0A7T5R2I7_9BACT|nr:MAG: hypothetical protein HYS17_00810 [Micavibrio aeruginosavorus]
MTTPSYLGRLWHDAAELYRNVDAALSHPGAMPATRRRLDESKIFAGAAVSAVSWESPLTLAGAALSIAEGFQDLNESGYKWRCRHHRFRL